MNAGIALVAEPLTGDCAGLLHRPIHVCIGVSPFNSYFSTDTITALAAWAVRTAPRVDFFVPDTPAIYTLRALGYPPRRARAKARRQGQYLHYKIRTAVQSIGVPDTAVGVLNWSALAASPGYRELLADVHRRYRRDELFRAACQRAAGWVLAGRLPAGQSPDPQQVRHATRYLLAELLLDTPTVAGVAASVFCYPRAPPFIRDLYHRRLPVAPVPGQGFALLRPPTRR